VSIVLIKIYSKVDNDNNTSGISIHLIHLFILFEWDLDVQLSRASYQTFLISCSIPKSFFFFIVSCSVTHQQRTCKPWMFRVARRPRLFSSLFHTFLSITLIVHVARMCAIHPSLLTSINMHFCSITVVVDETRKAREHRRFWNTRTAKKET
jgi:hypothetical protein